MRSMPLAARPCWWGGCSSGDPSGRPKDRTPANRLRHAPLAVSTLCLAALVVLHGVMDAKLDSGRLSGFYSWHRAYLWISTVQWLANLVLLLTAGSTLNRSGESPHVSPGKRSRVEARRQTQNSPCNQFKPVNLKGRSKGCCSAGRIAGSSGAEIVARVVVVEPDVLSILMPTGSVPRRDRGCRGEPAHGRRLGGSRAIRTAARVGFVLETGRPPGDRGSRRPVDIPGGRSAAFADPRGGVGPARSPGPFAIRLAARPAASATIPTLADDGPADPPRLSVPALAADSRAGRPLASPSSDLSHDGPRRRFGDPEQLRADPRRSQRGRTPGPGLRLLGRRRCRRPRPPQRPHHHVRRPHLSADLGLVRGGTRRGRGRPVHHPPVEPARSSGRRPACR